MKMVSFIGEWRVHPKQERCSCGSHRKMAKCHMPLYEALQKWSYEVRKSFLEMVAVISNGSLNK
jgi:hypothetical protein